MNAVQTAMRNTLKSLKHDVRFKKHRYYLGYDFRDEHHVIYYCVGEVQYREIYLLHELSHAIHYETLPLSFSENPRVVSLSHDMADEVGYYFGAVRDWFVLGRLYELCPEETLDLIRYEIEGIEKKYCSNLPFSDKLIAGLICAQGIYFLQEKSERLESDEKVKAISDILLSVSPHCASVENLCAAVNRLLKIFGHFVLEPTTESAEAWIVKQVKEIDRDNRGRLKRLFEGFSV